MKNLSTIQLFNKKECKKIIQSIEKNKNKLRVSTENGASYISAYELQLWELDKKIEDLVLKKVERFYPLRLYKCFIIKYNKDLITGMNGHYDGPLWRLFINLNTNFKGGELFFPFYKKFKYTPQQNPPGSGLLFQANTLNSWHEAWPVTEGTKYVMVFSIDSPDGACTAGWRGQLLLLKLYIATKLIEIFRKPKIYNNIK